MCYIIDIILCFISYKYFLQPFGLLFCCRNFFTLIDSYVIKISSNVSESCNQSSDIQFFCVYFISYHYKLMIYNHSLVVEMILQHHGRF